MAKLKKKPKKAKKEGKNKINNMTDCVSDDTVQKINVIDHLSEDIWFEIFTYFPLKLIFQLKLLSKQWYVLISSTNFITRKLNLCTFFFKTRPVRKPLLHHQLNPIVFSLNTDSSSDYFLSDQDYICNGFSFKFFPEIRHKGELCVLGSSNGLLLCRHSCSVGQPPYSYLICNPLTRRWVDTPESVIDCDDEHESHVLVCEFSSLSTWNTNPTGFKVVRIPEITIPSKKFFVKIFSSGKGVWKNHKILCSDKITMLSENTKKVVSDQNGRLYWIIEANKIVTYDVKNNVGVSGECMIIDLPKKEDDDYHGSARSCLAESEGCIFYIRIEIMQMNVSVWLLEEENDDSNEQWSWKVVHKVRLNEMLSGHEWSDTRIANMKPLGFSPMDRNIVYLQNGECILQYNIRTRRSQLLSLGSDLHGPISSYEFGLLPFLTTTKPTAIPVIREAIRL